MVSKTTLHAELEAILHEHGNRWMTTDELAREVNERERYRKRDGSSVTAFQVHGRTRNYASLFERDGSRVRLLTSGAKEPATDGPAPVSTSPRLSGDRVIKGNGDKLVTEALGALRPPGRSIPELRDDPPAGRGLYAIYADADTWKVLGLGEPPDDRPLYVGKAEDSLVSRDINTHFANGVTGSSTLRRSLAALLHGRLRLRGMPRNPAKPGYFSNYGLSPDDDEKLTDWMLAHLRLATWTLSAGSADLRPVESSVLQKLLPPLNLQGIHTPWSSHVSGSRRVMADEARTWGPNRA